MTKEMPFDEACASHVANHRGCDVDEDVVDELPRGQAQVVGALECLRVGIKLVGVLAEGWRLNLDFLQHAWANAGNRNALLDAQQARGIQPP